jgi:hypothetical protein
MLLYLFMYFTLRIKGTKLSLVGMQLPEKYKENLDVLRERPSFGVSQENPLSKLGLPPTLYPRPL